MWFVGRALAAAFVAALGLGRAFADEPPEPAPPSPPPRIVAALAEPSEGGARVALAMHFLAPDERLGAGSFVSAGELSGAIPLGADSALLLRAPFLTSVARAGSPSTALAWRPSHHE